MSSNYNMPSGIKRKILRKAQIATSSENPGRRFGDFSEYDIDSRAYKNILFYIQKGLSSYPELVKGILKPILQMQYEASVKYKIIPFTFGLDDEPFYKGKCFNIDSQPSISNISKVILELSGDKKSQNPAIIPRLFPKSTAANSYSGGKTGIKKKEDLLIVIGIKDEVFFDESIREKVEKFQKQILFVEIENENVNWHFYNYQPEFHKIIKQGINKMSTITRNVKEIPTTKIRDFYKLLGKFSTETHKAILADFSRKENVKHLLEIYKESKKHFSKYCNIEDNFVSDSIRKPIVQKPTINFSGTNDVVCLFERMKVVRIVSNSNLNFTYKNREISTLRTKGAKFDTLTSGKRSGQGGLDFIGYNINDQIPILGEIKVNGDKNAFFALIQLLTYLSELSTENQINRINKHNLFKFPSKKQLNIETKFYLYIVFADFQFSDIQREIFESTKILAKKITDSIEEIDDIVFLFFSKQSELIDQI